MLTVSSSQSDMTSTMPVSCAMSIDSIPPFSKKLVPSAAHSAAASQKPSVIESCGEPTFVTVGFCTTTPSCT